MTEKQQKVLNFIKTYIEMKGFPPSMQNIASGLGLKSRSNIHRIIHELKSQGLLALEPNKVRTLKVK